MLRNAAALGPVPKIIFLTSIDLSDSPEYHLKIASPTVCPANLFHPWPPGTSKPQTQHELKLPRESSAHVVVEKVVVVVVVAVDGIDLAKVAAPGCGASE